MFLATSKNCHCLKHIGCAGNMICFLLRNQRGDDLYCLSYVVEVKTSLNRDDSCTQICGFSQNIEDGPIVVNDRDPAGTKMICLALVSSILSQIFWYTVTDHFPSIFGSTLEKFIVVGWVPKWADGASLS